MILVCNAGPVIALAKIDCLTLLQQLGSSVSIPETVYHEVLAKPGAETARILQATRAFLKVVPVPNPSSNAVVVAIRQLDPGESEVIVLASSSLPPATALLDDAAGRRVAQKLGIPVMGFAGVLLTAKKYHLIDSITPYLLEARNHGYWLSDELICTARQLAAE
jgi:predicted nucleic acid-binding protein